MAHNARWFTKEFRDARFGGNVTACSFSAESRACGRASASARALVPRNFASLAARRGRAPGGGAWSSALPERLVFIGTCSVTTAPVGAS